MSETHRQNVYVSPEGLPPFIEVQAAASHALDGVQPPNALLREANLQAKKSWGQNFLCDQSVLACLAQTARAGTQDLVLELGAGLGALTHPLLALGGPVVAVERDRELAPVLRAYLSAAKQLHVLEGDALKVDYEAFFNWAQSDLVVAGNLPYQLSGRILGQIADASPWIMRAVFLLQEEVAQRLVAGPGSKVYGLLSVLVQRAYDAELVVRVSPAAFVPRPKVFSAGVVLRRKKEPYQGQAGRDLVAVARAGFAARRKTLRRALAMGLGATIDRVDAACAQAKIPGDCRAETLDIRAFHTLGVACRAMEILGKKGGA